MALRLGVGDTFTICKGVVDVCRASHDKPKEIHCIIAEMELIRAHLKVLDTKIGDERSFASSRSDISPIIKRSLEPIRRDLSQMRDLMNEHNRRQSVHVLDQVRWLALYGAKLDGFRDRLAAHRASVCVIGDLVEDQTPAERRNSILKLDTLVEEHERRREEEQALDQIQEEDLHSLGQHFSCAEAAPHPIYGDVQGQFEDNSTTKEVLGPKTEEQLFPITPISRALSPQPYLLGTISPSLMPKPTFKLDVFPSRAHQNQTIEGQPTTYSST